MSLRDCVVRTVIAVMLNCESFTLGSHFYLPLSILSVLDPITNVSESIPDFSVAVIIPQHAHHGNNEHHSVVGYNTVFDELVEKPYSVWDRNPIKEDG